MKRVHLGLFLLALTSMVGLGSGCLFTQSTRGENTIPHTFYGGCQIKGRHYHNTHVFIGDKYEPSLTEWLKY